MAAGAPRREGEAEEEPAAAAAVAAVALVTAGPRRWPAVGAVAAARPPTLPTAAALGRAGEGPRRAVTAAREGDGRTRGRRRLRGYLRLECW